jgi:hypothetical protein
MSSYVTAEAPLPKSVYRLRPELLEKNRRELVLTNAIVMLVCFGVVLLVFVVVAERRFIVGAIILLAFITVIFVTFTIWLLRRELRRLDRMYSSYVFEIYDDRVRRLQSDIPALELDRSDIARFEVIPGKGARLMTAKFATFIWIPDELDGYEDLIGELSFWKQPLTRTNLPFVFQQLVGNLLLLLGSVATILLPHRGTATLVGAATICFIVYSAAHAIRNPNNSNVLKRRSIWSLLMVAILAHRLWSLWTR